MYLELPDDGSRLQLQHVAVFSYTMYTVESRYDGTGLYEISPMESDILWHHSFNTVHKNITLLGFNDTKWCYNRVRLYLEKHA